MNISRSVVVNRAGTDQDGSVPGRHRQLQRTGLVATAAALSVAVLAGGAWAGYQELSGADCPATSRLRIAAAAEIAPAVSATAAAWSNQEGTCVAVTVLATDPAGTAAAIGGRHGVNLGGVGAGKPDPDVDVWIPDSSTWLVRIASEAPGFQPTDLGSIARSPLVLAAPEPAAKALGWPARTPRMKDLVRRIATDRALRAGIVDPARDAAGLAGLLALAGAAGTDAALKVGVMRALAANSSSIRTDLEQKFGTTVGLAPMSEADVLAYNAGGPPTRLAALYPDPASVVLDYPFAVMPGVDPQKAGAAVELRAALRRTEFTDELAKAGVRGAAGEPGAGFAAPPGAPAAVASLVPKDPAAIAQLLGSWTAITQPGRMLAVFDVSESMKAKVPTAGGLTRAQLTQGVARQGLALLDDRWSVGNWTFSTDMVGNRPWVENLPISPCATERPAMLAAIDRIVPRAGGDTGLFDTALAAYERVQQGWQPGVSNSVVIYTDGRNDNPGGLTIEQLVAKMTKARDPGRPVRMIIIGMGTAIDRNELESIARAAGSGGVFIATDPAKIGEIFLEAIASRRGA
ncbi:substrate-binding and VWA domain-containing protein [Paractinoplanes ferrugineus]|uniref:VWFA domain-containing protein n=1 Tax=Paractinoplanes ferrugineus TaxID=113564 RepID=A0A919J0Z1_9ACTN|nr:substrate-binding domain-containing protein [Actinoplanes ferrugineus]GIE11377.1 hypothetical protein Afe05nite_32170 [Actinoplanes ferrugineus]